MVEQKQSLKDVVKAMCKSIHGGREAMAGALGMTLTQFNNNLYEKNGCRFFEVSELEAMEDISNTSFAHCSSAPTKIRSGVKTYSARRSFGKNGMSCR